MEGAAAEIEAAQEKADLGLNVERVRGRRESRPSLPNHLPQVEVVIEPESTFCPCCSGPMHVIGEDVSRRLDVIPAQYQVLVTRRPKYACRACEEAVVQAPAPARLIEGGLPTERLVAQILVGKYADHCPLYRQAQGFAHPVSFADITPWDRPLADGIELDRSTLAFWVGYAAAELKPLWRLGDLMVAVPNGHGSTALLSMDARRPARREPALRRRDPGTGPRAGPRAHQDGLLLGHRPQ